MLDPFIFARGTRTLPRPAALLCLLLAHFVSQASADQLEITSLEQTNDEMLYTIENYHKSKPSVFPGEYREWKAWRIVGIDPKTGNTKAVTDWSCCSSEVLHPTGGGEHARASAMLYSGYFADDKERNRRSKFLFATNGYIYEYDLYKNGKTKIKMRDPGLLFKDANDGFNYAVGGDPYINDQLSLYEVDDDVEDDQSLIALNHIATLKNPTHNVAAFQDIMLAPACGIKMGGGCNIQSGLLYTYWDGLWEISRATGNITKIADAHAFQDMYQLYHLWVDIEGAHPPKELVIAARNGSSWNVSNNVLLRVDRLTGSITSVPLGSQGDLDKCSAYDHMKRLWYLGCETILAISMDTWQVVGTTSVKHPDVSDPAESYSISGLEIYLHAALSSEDNENSGGASAYSPALVI